VARLLSAITAVAEMTDVLKVAFSNRNRFDAALSRRSAP
jgi:hypothetical protein